MDTSPPAVIITHIKKRAPSSETRNILPTPDAINDTASTIIIDNAPVNEARTFT